MPRIATYRCPSSTQSDARPSRSRFLSLTRPFFVFIRIVSPSTGRYHITVCCGAPSAFTVASTPKRSSFTNSSACSESFIRWHHPVLIFDKSSVAKYGRFLGTCERKPCGAVPAVPESWGIHLPVLSRMPLPQTPERTCSPSVSRQELRDGGNRHSTRYAIDRNSVQPPGVAQVLQLAWARTATGAICRVMPKPPGAVLAGPDFPCESNPHAQCAFLAGRCQCCSGCRRPERVAAARAVSITHITARATASRSRRIDRIDGRAPVHSSMTSLGVCR